MFMFHTDIKANKELVPIPSSLVHPEIVEGFKKRNCNTHCLYLSDYMLYAVQDENDGEYIYTRCIVD